MEVDNNQINKIPDEIFEELDKMSKEKETILNSNKVDNNVGITTSTNEIKNKNIITPKDKESEEVKESVNDVKKEDDKKEEVKKEDNNEKPFILSDLSDKNISEIKKALGETENNQSENKKEDIKKLEDVSEPPKLDDKKENDEEEKQKKKKKKEKASSSVLSAIEKKRYENLGKAFMIGADSALTEIQNAIERKEQNKLSGKDKVENQIKDAEEKIKKDKKSKSSVLKKIVVAAAALGGLYLLFSGTINVAFTNMYTKIKNGVMGFGDFIKKSASSILHFFGNMFIKAARTLSGGGVLTVMLGGIIWDFFNYTLPKMIIGMVEDLMKMIDGSFKSSVTLEKSDVKLDGIQKRTTSEAENVSGMMKAEIDKFLLSQETTVRENSILTSKSQEDIADKSISEIKKSYDVMLSSSKQSTDANAKVIRGWSNSVINMMLGNQMSSTKFYNNSTNVLRAIDLMLPNLKSITKDNVEKITTQSQKDFIKNFGETFGASLGMNEEEIRSFGKLSLNYQLEVLQNIAEGSKKFKESVDRDILEAEKNADPDESNKGVIKILNSMRKKMDEKDSYVEIIKFQETAAISELNYNIRKFLYESKFLKVLEDFSGSVSYKFNSILDAANVALANLPKAVAANFVYMNGDEEVYLNNISDNFGAETISIPAPDEYKLMYVFNNNVPYMDTIIDKDMTTFLNFSVAYTQLMGQELAVLSQLERLTTILANGIFYNSELVRDTYNNIKKGINDHVNTPVSYQGQTAHVLVQKNQSMASADIPLMASNSGMIII